MAEPSPSGDAGEEAPESGLFSILFSPEPSPLRRWGVRVRNGQCARVKDPEIATPVVEIVGTNAASNFITCPQDHASVLAVRLPMFYMLVKSVDARPFFFEVQVLDDKNIRRRFRASNFQGTTRVKPFICGMPLKLVAGWNTILFDLPTLTMKAFGTKFVMVTRVQIHASCRVQRVFFADRAYEHKELPRDFTLYAPGE